MILCVALATELKVRRTADAWPCLRRCRGKSAAQRKSLSCAGDRSSTTSRCEPDTTCSKRISTATVISEAWKCKRHTVRVPGRPGLALSSEHRRFAAVSESRVRSDSHWAFRELATRPARDDAAVNFKRPGFCQQHSFACRWNCGRISSLRVRKQEK